MQGGDVSDVLLVTGGAGYIGGNFVLGAIGRGACVVNLDALTYAGNLATLASIRSNPNHRFVHGDIADRRLVERLVGADRASALINLAAAGHLERLVDR